MKKCIDCGKMKPAYDFPANKNVKDGLHPYCRECNRARAREWRKNNIKRLPDYDKEHYQKNKQYYVEYRRVKRYGITLEKFNKMLMDCNNRCPGCDEGFSNLNKHSAPSIDHDHSCCSGRETCGKCIRGIICGKCNLILGWANDNRQTLMNLSEYLKGV